VVSALLFATCMSATSSAGAAASRLTHLQVNRTMALPGVVLSPGLYTFQVLNPESSGNAVLVTSGTSNRRAHFLGFTRPVERPRNMPEDQTITVREARAGEPVPITAWYPVGYASGHEFIYE
jgi:hypothetical protein